MCMMCDGYTHEESVRHFADLTEEHGWAFIGVDAHPFWAYTVGITWNLDHPELILVGGSMRSCAGILHRIVDQIADGERFVVGSTVEYPDAGSVRFGAVHDRNLFDEWFAQWPFVARAAGHGTTGLRALQVIVDCGDDCLACESQILLDRRCTRAEDRTPRGRRRR